MLPDNASIAILTKLNELAERHGLHPCEFVASLETTRAGVSVLCFDSPPENEQAAERFARMLEHLGVEEDSLQCNGTDAQIYDRIIAALKRAPAMRPHRS